MAGDASLRPQSVISRSERAVHGELPEETVLVDLGTGKSLRLNSTAAWLWRRIEHPAPLCELADGLAGEFGIDSERALGDVEAFAVDLAGRGLIEVEG
jgi:hypothetical protein